jgi:hypothetical protein
LCCVDVDWGTKENYTQRGVWFKNVERLWFLLERYLGYLQMTGRSAWAETERWFGQGVGTMGEE